MIRLFFHCLIALTPYWLKNRLYRHLCGYDIDNRARIGISPIVVQKCRIRDNVRIGHFNLFWKTEELVIEDHARIGHLNLFRGGKRIVIERYAEIFRANVINSILEPEVETPIDPCFRLGAGSVVTTAHWIDFTDAVTIGARSILGGRLSSIWTHSRQWTRPVSIGNHVYLGSEVRIAPGVAIPSHSIVALGSVLMDSIEECGRLIAGNPARPVKPLSEHNLRLLERKTRRDLPDEVGAYSMTGSQYDLRDGRRRIRKMGLG